MNILVANAPKIAGPRLAGASKAVATDSPVAAPTDSVTLSAVGKLPEGATVSWSDSARSALATMAFAAPAALGGAIGGNAVIPGFLATTMIGTWAVGGQGSDDVVGLTGAMLSLGGATALTAVGMATGWKGAAIITLGAGLAAGWLDRPGQRQN